MASGAVDLLGLEVAVGLLALAVGLVTRSVATVAVGMASGSLAPLASVEV